LKFLSSVNWPILPASNSANQIVPSAQGDEVVSTNNGRPPTAHQMIPTGRFGLPNLRQARLASFDPMTETFKEFSLPGPEATPYALAIDKNHSVWYSSEHLDVIGNSIQRPTRHRISLPAGGEYDA